MVGSGGRGAGVVYLVNSAKAPKKINKFMTFQ